VTGDPGRAAVNDSEVRGISFRRFLRARNPTPEPSERVFCEDALMRQAGKKSSRERIPGRTIVKYALLQIPGTVLLVLVLILVKRWVQYPQWLYYGIIGIWVAKDIILFPFLWRAYDSRGGEVGHDMIGARGIAEERLDPEGYVRVRGELWRAQVRRNSPPIEKGSNVRVWEIQGLTLLVDLESPSRPEARV